MVLSANSTLTGTTNASVMQIANTDIIYSNTVAQVDIASGSVSFDVNDRAATTTDAFIVFSSGTHASHSNLGSITNNSNTGVLYNVTSDERLKNWKIPQKSYEKAIQDLWVGDFTWKANGHQDFGVRAQQAFPLFPEAINKPTKASGTWQADYGRFAPLALWGVKDLYKKKEIQDREIAALMAANEKLKLRIAKLERR
jgi:hypothetical protein